MRTARSDRLRIVRVGVAFCTTLVLTGGCFEAEQVSVKREREKFDQLGEDCFPTIVKYVNRWRNLVSLYLL